MNLFKGGKFVLHSGASSSFKIDCDSLTDEDIFNIARIISEKKIFSSVYGVPSGGTRLAKALEKYCNDWGPRLVVDDVLTTGNSMKEVYKDGDTGVVIFARGECPKWVRPIFQMWE